VSSGSSFGAKELGQLRARLSDLVLLPGPARSLLLLDVLGRGLRLHQGGLVGTFKVLHLDGEEGEFRNGLQPLLRTPFQDVLFFEPPGVALYVVAPSDLVAFLHVFHRKQFVVLVAHVAQAKVRGRAV
jgi:hypothetical protein